MSQPHGTLSLGQNGVRAAVACFAFALAACESGGGTSFTDRSVRIIVGRLRFAPDMVTVKACTSVRFVLVNADAIDHEFVLGTEEVQQQHEKMMMGGHAMMQTPASAEVPAGRTVELTYTFDEPGTLIYGCHIPRHYGQGMRGTVTVT